MPRRTRAPKRGHEPFGYGQRCNARTRTGGRCILTLGHSGGHRRAAGSSLKRR